MISPGELNSANFSFHSCDLSRGSRTPKSPHTRRTNYLARIQQSISEHSESALLIRYRDLKCADFDNIMEDLVHNNPQIFKYLSSKRQDISSAIYAKLSRTVVKVDWKELVNVRVQTVGKDKNDIHKPTVYLSIVQEAYTQFIDSGENSTEDKITFVQSIQWGFLSTLTALPSELKQLFNVALDASEGKILAVDTSKSNYLSIYTIKWLMTVVCDNNPSYVQFLTPQNVNLWRHYLDAYQAIEDRIQDHLHPALATIRAYRVQLIKKNAEIPIEEITQLSLEDGAKVELSRRKFSFLKTYRDQSAVEPYYGKLIHDCRTIYYYDMNEERHINKLHREIGKGVSVYLDKHQDENVVVVDSLNDLTELLQTLPKNPIKLVISGHYFFYTKRRGFAGFGFTPEQSATAIARLVDTYPFIHKLMLLGCTTAELNDVPNYDEQLEKEIATNRLSYQTDHYRMFSERKQHLVDTQHERTQKPWNPLAHNLKMTAQQAKTLLSPAALINLVYKELTRKDVSIKGYAALVFEVGQRIVITNDPELDIAVLESEAEQEKALVDDRRKVTISRPLPFFKSYTIVGETQALLTNYSP